MSTTNSSVAASSNPGPNPNLIHLIQLQKLMRQLEVEGRRANKHVAELRATIPPHLLRCFDHAAQHGRAAVARVSGSGVCGSCHLKLPSGLASTVHVFNEHLDKCPYCGCFIFTNSELEMAEKTVADKAVSVFSRCLPSTARQ